MKIFIIIPVHNRKDRTRQCLLSLEKQTEKFFETIVVDDGSTDGTTEMIQNEFPAVQVLTGSGNLWWAGATNLGIQHVLNNLNADDLILLLNNDLVVPDDFISNAYKAAYKYPETLIGSVVTDVDEKDFIFSGGVRINWATAKWLEPNKGKTLTDFPRGYILDVSTLTGRGVLIPASVFEKVGLYNSKHLPQCGDTEFPVRAARAGFRLIVDYSMIVYHDANENEHISYRNHYKLTDASEYFFSIKSHTFLKDRFWFAVSTLNNPLRIIRYLFFDLVRTIGHFIIRLRFIE